MPKLQPDELTIEDVFGFSVADDTEPEPEPAPIIEGDPVNLDDLLVSPTPEVAPEVATPLDAARAVRAAVLAHKGKRKSVDAWRGVAAEAMGLKRLVQARWEGVLAEGVANGLFRIDEDTLSYPHIIPTDTPEPDATDDEIEVEVRTPLPTRPPAVITQLPESFNPPRNLPCGHMDLARKTPADHEASQAEGFCCWYGQHRKSFKRHWFAMKEPYLSKFTVPQGQRRDWNKSGFSGYCTDKDGRYIGGAFNDCRYHCEDGDMSTLIKHPFNEWCAACQVKYTNRQDVI